SEDILVGCLHRQLGLPVVDLNECVPEPEALALIKEELAKKHIALPIVAEKRTLQVAMADPLNVAALEDLRFHSNRYIQPLLARPSTIAEAIERYYNMDQSVSAVIDEILGDEDDLEVATVDDGKQGERVEDLIRESEGRPIVRLTNWLLHRAIEERASDIHVEPQDKNLVIRLRIDGLLHEVQRLPKWTTGAFVSRLKVLANLDIAERRHPQDGRLMVNVKGRRIDMRVNTLPTTYGEKVVMRIADQERAPVELSRVGLMDDDLHRVQKFI